MYWSVVAPTVWFQSRGRTVPFFVAEGQCAPHYASVRMDGLMHTVFARRSLHRAAASGETSFRLLVIVHSLLVSLRMFRWFPLTRFVM